MSTEKNTKAKPNTVTVTVKNAASTEQTAELDVRKQKDSTLWKQKLSSKALNMTNTFRKTALLSSARK